MRMLIVDEEKHSPLLVIKMHQKILLKFHISFKILILIVSYIFFLFLATCCLQKAALRAKIGLLFSSFSFFSSCLLTNAVMFGYSSFSVATWLALLSVA